MERMLEATALAEERHYWFRALRRQARVILDGALAGRRPVQVIDCGTGTGRNLEWLLHYGRAVGVELRPLGVEIARRHDRVVVRGSVTALPVATESVDLATSFDVLYCMSDDAEAAAIREMWRVLTPGGLALLNVAALDVLKGSHSALTGEVRRYTPGRLRQRLVDASFIVERLTFVNMTLFPLALATRTLERVRGTAGTPSDADLRVPWAPVNRTLDACLAIEARLLRHMNLPIGTSLMAIARKPS